MQHLSNIPGSMGKEPCGEPCGESDPDGVTPLLQLFKGKFYHCLGVDIRNITNRSDCVAANYKWVHHKYNFDNLGQVSLLTAPPSNGNPIQGLSPPQGTDAVPGKPMPGPERAVIWHGCPCRSCVTSGLVSKLYLQDEWERKVVAAESLIFSFLLPQSRCYSQPLSSGGSGCTWLPVTPSLVLHREWRRF